MSKSAKGVRFMLYIPEDSRDKFSAYKNVCRKLGKKSISKEIWELVSKDADRLFALIEILEKEKEKEKK